MNKNKIYFFVGIKGTGMASMALILHDLGYKVMGDDVTQTTFTQHQLIKDGISVLDFNVKNLKPNYVYILGNSFNRKNNPEIKIIEDNNYTHYRYHQFLGQMIKGYISIGITGTHGKTTTTGMLSHVLSPIAKTNYLIGDGEGQGVKGAKFFVYEADEYRRHCLATYPDYAILNNCDFDHPDYFLNQSDYNYTMQEFMRNARKGILIWGEDPRLRTLAHDLKMTNSLFSPSVKPSYLAPVHTFGTKDNDDFQAININRNTHGSDFDVTYHDKKLGHFTIHLFGKYNILHALAVIAVAYKEHVNLHEVQRQLANFKGEKRRFTHHHVGDMEIIDDYAHQPNEILATLGEARQQYPDKKLIVVFQPHTYSRIEAFLHQFGTSLSHADAVYVTKIFSSPRENHGSVTSQDIVNQITKPSAVIHGTNMHPLLKYHHQVVIFMGAGDIPKYEKAYEDLLK